MPRALNLLRRGVHYRREAFSDGLRAAGLDVVDGIEKPKPGDVVLIWNRYGGHGETAQHFASRGATVLVAENCPLGNDWRPGGWYSLALDHVAMTGGRFHVGGPERWQSFGYDLAPWKRGGSEVVILGQRSIGHADVASPTNWAEKVQRRIGGRIRAHPGIGPCVPLAKDLQGARAVVTWSSAAAVQALAMGYPVWCKHKEFIGAHACRLLSAWGAEPLCDDAARLRVFERMAWAMWSLDEIRTGAPIRRLVESA